MEMDFGKFVKLHNEGKIKCGKIRYKNQNEASIALSNVRERRGSSVGRTEKRFYLCGRCNGYHLTSKQKYPRRETA